MAQFLIPTFYEQTGWPMTEAVNYDDDSFDFWPFMMQNAGQRKRRSRPQDWTQVLDMRHFAPSELNVEVNDDKVMVVGRHEDVHGENQDTYETKRILKVPEDVDMEKLKTRVTEGRKVVVTAPYLRKEEDTSMVETSAKTLAPQPPTTSYQVVDKEDGTKEFQLMVNMGDFTDKDLTVRTNHNTLYIDGEKEWEHEGMKGMQEIHRQFAIPGVGEMGEAKAVRDETGTLKVMIPLKSMTQTDTQKIPIMKA